MKHLARVLRLGLDAAGGPVALGTMALWYSSITVVRVLPPLVDLTTALVDEAWGFAHAKLDRLEGKIAPTWV